MKYVIAGCGSAGISAAHEIAKWDDKGEIIIISEDHHPFYRRMHLVEFIAGRLQESNIIRTEQDVFKDIDVKVLAGKRIVSIKPEENRIRFTDGENQDYNFLLLATGAKPDLNELEFYQNNFYSVNSLNDAVRLKRAAAEAESAVIIGSNFLAVELARAFLNLGLETHLVSRKERFWTRDAMGVTKNDIEAVLKNSQVRRHDDRGIADIQDIDGEMWRVITKSGVKIDAKLIVSAQRMAPNIGYTIYSGIKTDRGILVNEELRTNIPNIFAAGDCAQFYDINRGMHRINLGWASGTKQGQTAGQNMAGKDKVYVIANDEFFLDLKGKNLLERWK